MASIQKRINKDSTISYRIKVSNGLKANGKPNIVSKTWKPKNNMTQSQINKELNKICIQFEEEVKKGLLIDENVLFSTYSYDWLENKKNGIANKTYEGNTEYEKYQAMCKALGYNARNKMNFDKFIELAKIYNGRIKCDTTLDEWTEQLGLIQLDPSEIDDLPF